MTLMLLITKIGGCRMLKNDFYHVYRGLSYPELSYKISQNKGLELP